jgi:hypothetical protein
MHAESKQDARRGMRDSVETRTRLLDAWILGLSYDVAVLQANYIIDRGFRGSGAKRAFDDEL